jgi:hypothetical protein
MLSIGKLVKKPGGKAAPIREPAHHQADDADIDDAGTETADHAVGDVERGEALGLCGQHPAAARHDRADRDQQLRPEAVDQVRLERREERLQDDQQREGELQLGERRAELLVERSGEQRPDVLRARDRHHGDEAEQKLNPAIRERRRRRRCGCDGHGVVPLVRPCRKDNSARGRPEANSAGAKMPGCRACGEGFPHSAAGGGHLPLRIDTFTK